MFYRMREMANHFVKWKIIELKAWVLTCFNQTI